MSNMVVRTNVFALNAHRNMKNVGVEQQRASNRLASGFRINSAADDAAGLAISETMRAQIRGLDQASRNAQDGQALINTAEGGMQEIQNMMQRIRELTVQAANDTNAPVNREQIGLEISQLLDEIDSMANRVEFNGMRLLDGGFAARDPNFKLGGLPGAPGVTPPPNNGAPPTASFKAGDALQFLNQEQDALWAALADAFSDDTKGRNEFWFASMTTPPTTLDTTASVTLLDAVPHADALKVVESLFNQAIRDLVGYTGTGAPSAGLQQAVADWLVAGGAFVTPEAVAGGDPGVVDLETLFLADLSDPTSIGTGATTAQVAAIERLRGELIDALGNVDLRNILEAVPPPEPVIAPDWKFVGDAFRVSIDAIARGEFTDFVKAQEAVHAALQGYIHEITGNKAHSQVSDLIAFLVDQTGNNHNTWKVAGAYAGFTGGSFEHLFNALSFQALVAAPDLGAAGLTDKASGAVGDGTADYVRNLIEELADRVGWHNIKFMSATDGIADPNIEFDPFDNAAQNIWVTIDGITFKGVVGALDADNTASLTWTVPGNNGLTQAGLDMRDRLLAVIENTLDQFRVSDPGANGPGPGAKAADGPGLWFQIGANSNQGMIANVADMRLWERDTDGNVTNVPLSVDSLGGSIHGFLNTWEYMFTKESTKTGEDISTLIDQLETGLQYVSMSRAALGAMSNRLDFTSRSLDISSENLSDAESRVRNTDMAREMMRFTMSNVLQQAAVSMLAQANQLPNNLLQLLR